jgi:electron transport complex protein RnfE
MNRKKQFTEGLITNNPVLVQQIGMCATMAITTTLFNGVGMGLSVLIILTCCNVVISAIRKIIPGEIRLAIFVVVIAGFVTIVDLLLQAFVPALSEALGVFIPLIVVNCIIIGRAEAFCQKMPVKDSFFDGIFQGLGYTLVLIIMCVVREFLGSGRLGGGLGRLFLKRPRLHVCARKRTVSLLKPNTSQERSFNAQHCHFFCHSLYYLILAAAMQVAMPRIWKSKTHSSWIYAPVPPS